MLCGVASLSIQAANVEQFAGERLAWSKHDVAILEIEIGELQDLISGTYFDDSLANRRGGSLHGGCVQLVVTRSETESGAPLAN